MSLTIAALIRDVDTGRDRGVRLVVDGTTLRIVLASAKGPNEAGVDITDHAPAIVAALTPRKDER